MKSEIEKLLSYYLKFFQYVQINGLTVEIDDISPSGMSEIHIFPDHKISVVAIEDRIILMYHDSSYTETLHNDFWELLKRNDNNPQKAFISWYNRYIMLVYKEQRINLKKNTTGLKSMLELNYILLSSLCIISFIGIIWSTQNLLNVFVKMALLVHAFLLAYYIIKNGVL